MAYQGTKTWAAGPWTFSDANTYIRDNFISVRRYQTSIVAFNDQANVNTSALDYGTHVSIGSSTPDEATQLIVMVNGTLYNPAGGVGFVTITVKDNVGTVIGLATAPNFSAGQVAFATGGVNVYAAGTNPGFKLTINTNAGTASAIWVAHAILRPLV